MTSLKSIAERTVSVDEYINSLPQHFKEKFLDRKRTYRLEKDVIQKLSQYGGDIFIMVFSAGWCKDCTANVPILALLAEKTDVRVRVFGGLKKDPLNPEENWRIPPSPPEVKKFKVEKIPHIIVFHREGRKLGTIIEGPKAGKTLEEEILNLIQR